MLFGEIVEPSTRALIGDDEENYPEYTEPVINWKGNFATPKTIDTLVFVENQKINSLFQRLVLHNEKPIASLENAGLNIYNIEINKYIITFTEEKDLTCGQIVQVLSPWIKTSKNTYTITSAPIATYLNDNLVVKPVSVIRSLSTDLSKSLGYEKLESPNLITGLGANVLSFCIHSGLQCTLFVLYLDSVPLDSLNSSPLLQLLNKLQVPLKTSDLRISTPSSNLYM